MAVAQPDHEGVVVNVETLGAAARTLDAVRGLTDWAGEENIGVPFGDTATFGPADGLGGVHDRAMTVAWEVVGRVEKASARYADGVADAAAEYGWTDRHSAAAIDAAARGMTGTAPDPGKI